MMNKLEVFFDYACPYCKQGHEYLTELLPLYPQIEVVWRPCEAHPRPETYGPHSDLCIQGMFYALEYGADIWKYHEKMYKAALKDRIDIENPQSLAEYTAELFDSANGLLEALKNKTYEKVQLDSNDYAYEKSGVWAVPSYRMNEKKLDAAEGIGVTKKQLQNFMDSYKNRN